MASASCGSKPPSPHCSRGCSNPQTLTLWRGSLLPLGCEAVVKPVNSVLLEKAVAASRPIGSKLPRHKCLLPYRSLPAGRYSPHKTD
ncbi:hypothetical protein EI534_11790 [Pseudomonas frederiksbergensis]|nr:hypothetical protein [Pseudomonas frederiksbergensis]